MSTTRCETADPRQYDDACGSNAPNTEQMFPGKEKRDQRPLPCAGSMASRAWALLALGAACLLVLHSQVNFLSGPARESLCVSVSLYLSLSLSLSSVSVCVPVSVSLCLSQCLCLYVCVSLSSSLCTSLPLSLSLSLSLRLSLSVSLSLCLSLSLSLPPPLSLIVPGGLFRGAFSGLGRPGVNSLSLMENRDCTLFFDGVLVAVVLVLVVLLIFQLGTLLRR